MQIKVFSIIARGDPDAEKEMNKFLRSNRILTVDKYLVQSETPSYWTFSIEYILGEKSDESRSRRVDYREILSSEEFELFSKLRDLRKQIAKEEGVQVFMIFNNEQLAGMVKNKITNKKELAELPGVGESRIQKYGDRFIQFLSKNETTRISD